MCALVHVIQKNSKVTENLNRFFENRRSGYFLSEFFMKYLFFIFVLVFPVLSMADNYEVAVSPPMMCDGDYTHDTAYEGSTFDACTGSLVIGPVFPTPGVEWCSAVATITNLNTGETSQKILPQNSWMSISSPPPQECADLPLELGSECTSN